MNKIQADALLYGAKGVCICHLKLTCPVSIVTLPKPPQIDFIKKLHQFVSVHYIIQISEFCLKKKSSPPSFWYSLQLFH